MKLLPLALLLLALPGCATVPQTQIRIPTKLGIASIDSPKETGWTNVVIEFKADGTMKFSIGAVAAHNDANVIAAVAAANAAMADKALQLGEKAIELGVEGAKQGLVPGMP